MFTLDTNYSVCGTPGSGRCQARFLLERRTMVVCLCLCCDRDDADDYQDWGNVNNHGGVPVPMMMLGMVKVSRM